MVKKQRLDRLLVERGVVETRARARILIMAGEVLVNGERVDRPGTLIRDDARVRLKTPMPYVSRGGHKLAAALQTFAIDVAGRVCADVGACTGGFTDVLLQNGAARVYAIDVGYGQLDWKLRQDQRVVILERTNARYLKSLGETVTFVCVDVSFISLRLILPAVIPWLGPDADLVVLVKPQFEAGRKQVGKGGIVRDTGVHRQVLQEVIGWSQEQGMPLAGLIRSPIKGSDGNVEYLAWLRQTAESLIDVGEAIAQAAGANAQ
jgi:23S rRNA (cytidine1920-2'-O)/16S rRNA (cytidine1409-2'-O)-methyltransferase